MARLLGTASLAAVIGVISLLPLSSLVNAQAAPEVTAACAADKSPKLKEIQERGLLRWALGIAAPFAAKDAQNEYVGADPDSARELAGILGVDLELRDYSYNLLPPTVATGIADIAGTLYITDERRQVLEFSIPWQQDGQLFAVLGERDDLSSIDELNQPDVRVITRVGSGQVDLAKRILPRAQIITAEVTPGGEAQYLMARQAEATIIDAVSAPLLQKAAGDVAVKMIGKRGALPDQRPAEEDLIDPFPNGFGVAKGDPGFVACLDAWVADGVSKGRFHERFVHWIDVLTQ